jgi:hypothetical protein
MSKRIKIHVDKLVDENFYKIMEIYFTSQVKL